MLRLVSVLFGSALLLTACGTAPEDRAVSGAGIGAAGGAIIGAITGLTVVEGAALGALGGALTGVLSDSESVNLGEPPWRRSSAAANSRDELAWDGAPTSNGGGAAPGHAPTRSALVGRVQAGLADRGYDPGPVDGVMGPRTAAAIREYQEDRGLLTDGRASLELAEHIELASN